MGFDEPCFQDTDDDMIRTLLDSRHPFIDGITLEQLDSEHSVRLKIGDPFLPFANGGFGTPSGKCEFHAETLDYEPPVESRLGDPALASAFSARTDLAQERRQHELDLRHTVPTPTAQTAALKLHPADAAPRAIATGDAVRVFNDRGQCMLRAEVSETVARASSRAPSSAGRSSRRTAIRSICSPPSASPTKAAARRSIVV